MSDAEGLSKAEANSRKAENSKFGCHKCTFMLPPLAIGGCRYVCGVVRLGGRYAGRYAPMVDIERRPELIARYRAGVEEVEAALSGADEAELDAVPPDGGWTARMVVHHLADSESNSYLRVRTLLAEDEAFVQGYDEERFAERLHYERPTDASLAVFRAVRASTAELLDQLGDADWNRVGTHSESGTYSMDDWLDIYAAHAFDHADQIRRARGATPGT